MFDQLRIWVRTLALTGLLLGCGSGGQSEVVPSSPPEWSTWNGGANTPVATFGVVYRAYFADRSGNVFMYGETADSLGSPSGVVRAWKFSPSTGWVESAVQPGLVAAGGILRAPTLYAGGYLLSTNAAGLAFDFKLGWIQLPPEPASPPNLRATPLQVTVDSAGSLMGSRIVGEATAASELEIFRLEQTGWQIINKYALPAVSDVPAGYSIWGWTWARASLTTAGPVVAAAYSFAPRTLTNWVGVTISLDRGTAALLSTCSSSQPDCFNWRTFPNGDLYGFMNYPSHSRGYYRRETGQWTPMVNGTLRPGSSLAFEPVLVHSEASRLFTERCAEGEGFCEGNELVRFVDLKTGAKRIAIASNPIGTLSHHGRIALLRGLGAAGSTAPSLWQIAYRRAEGEYSEPVDFPAEGNVQMLGVFESGDTRQYAVGQRVTNLQATDVMVYQRDR